MSDDEADGKGFWKALVDKGPLFIVAVGAVLLVIAAASKFEGLSLNLEINELLWRIVLAVVGIILIVFGGFATIGSLRENESGPSKKPNAYGITIEEPGERETEHGKIVVKGKFEVKGKYKRLPEDLRLAVFELNPRSGDYWLKGHAQIDKSERSWRVSYVSVGISGGKDTILLAVVMGKGGVALSNYFKRVVEQVRVARDKHEDPSLPVPGIPRLTPDTVECARITVWQE